MTLFGFDRRDVATIWNFSRMFLRDRYLGSRLGTVWAVVNPLLMLAIFTFVFGFVFKARLPGAETTFAYSIWLIAGYGPWLAISESLNASALTVVSNGGIVKNMAFKTECLPLAATLVGVVPLMVSIVFVVILMFFDGNVPTWHAIAVFPGIILGLMFLAAIGTGFAALTVFVRDFGLILPTLLTAMLFGTPILYPAEAVPGFLRAAAVWNPFYLISEFVRQPLVYHKIPPLQSWLYVAVLTSVIAGINLRIFRRLKGSFTSVL